MLLDVMKKITPEVLISMAEIQQSRSPFQLEKFVIGQHETPEMQYQKCVLEIQQLYYTIKTVNLQIKKTEVQIDRLRQTGDEIDEIEAQLKEVELEQTRLIGIGAIREFEYLLEVYNSFENKYTRDEIDNAQPEYWEKRLTRQAMLESVSNNLGQGSNLEALRQIGALTLNKENLSIEDKQDEAIPATAV